MTFVTNTEKPASIAVIIPCYNEGLAIAHVVKAFKQYLPTATIYVYDNNSKDDTKLQAQQAGAMVRSENRQGKGHVIRRAFADVEADIYVMVDGDGTYDAASAPAMVEKLLSKQLDMLVGTRSSELEAKTYRRGHRFGNRLLTQSIALLFGSQFTDVLSGYRVFSRRFVKSFPALAKGFEIEAMLTIHALELRLPCSEHITPYYERIEGTQSKLKTYQDGFKILFTILSLFKDIRPFAFFGGLAAFLAVSALILMFPVLQEFFDTGLVRRFPTAIAAMGMITIAGIFLTSGLILDNVSRNRLEQKRLVYLQYPL